jgi:hypothetical protein
MRELTKLRRGRARWVLLRALEAGRPIGANQTVLHRILLDLGFPYSMGELQKELVWLQNNDLIAFHEQHDRAELEQEDWAELTMKGIATAEYAAPAPAGIVRPRVK